MLFLPSLVGAQDYGATDNGPYGRPEVTCDGFTNTIQFTASAGAKQGFQTQWVAYRFGIYQRDVGWLTWGDAANQQTMSDWEWLATSGPFYTAPVPGAGAGGGASYLTSASNTVSRAWGPFTLGEGAFAVLVEYWWDGGGSAWAWANQVFYAGIGPGVGWDDTYWCETTIQ